MPPAQAFCCLCLAVMINILAVQHVVPCGGQAANRPSGQEARGQAAKQASGGQAAAKRRPRGQAARRPGAKRRPVLASTPAMELHPCGPVLASTPATVLGWRPVLVSTPAVRSPVLVSTPAVDLVDPVLVSTPAVDLTWGVRPVSACAPAVARVALGPSRGQLVTPGALKHTSA